MDELNQNPKIGKEASRKLARRKLMFDPFQINSFLELVDAFNQKTVPKIRELAFKNMLKHEVYKKIGDVYLMKGAEYNETELQTAIKLTKAGYWVVFPSKEQIKQIKKLERDKTARKNDVYIFYKDNYKKYKVEIKTMGKPSIETIESQIVSGSEQAPHLVVDITGTINKTQLIKGIKAGWSKNKNLRTMYLNYRGKWYEIDKKKVENKWLDENVK